MAIAFATPSAARNCSPAVEITLPTGLFAHERAEVRRYAVFAGWHASCLVELRDRVTVSSTLASVAAVVRTSDSVRQLLMKQDWMKHA